MPFSVYPGVLLHYRANTQLYSRACMGALFKLIPQLLLANAVFFFSEVFLCPWRDAALNLAFAPPLPQWVACLCSTPPSVWVACLCWAGTFFDTLSARGRVSTGMLLISFLLTRGFILSSENRWCWRRTFHYRFPWMFKRRNWSDGQSWWNGVDLLLILLLNPLCSANI